MYKVELWEMTPRGWRGESARDEYRERLEVAIACAMRLMAEAPAGMTVCATVTDADGVEVWCASLGMPGVGIGGLN